MKKHKPPACYATHLNQQFGKPGTATREAYDNSIQATTLGQLIQVIRVKQMLK